MHQYRPASMPTLSPYLTVSNAQKMIDFYQNAFDFQIRDIARDENNNIVHVEMTILDAVIMFVPEGAWGIKEQAPASLGQRSPLALYIYHPAVDAVYQRALQAGAQGLMEPADMFWGDRFCSLLDPDGYVWNFASALQAAKE